MPREIITIQIGQCGNQIGRRFWQMALQEHAQYSTGGFDDSMSSFFRLADAQSELLQAKDLLKRVKARAVLIDMEQGVVNETLGSDLGFLFDAKQQLTSTDGSGNNWAHGYFEYGQQYGRQLEDVLHHPIEQCDSLQSFFIMHSLGGGTGSGFGSYVLGALADLYPDVYRFTASVFPSDDDDVVTSPYNSLLSLSRLIESADCVLPIHNQALIEIVNRIQAMKGTKGVKSTISDMETKKAKPFDTMNNMIAHALINLTASARFGGPLNVDINEITTNLVPFPRLHFLTSSLAPLAQFADVGAQPRGIDSMFTDAFSKDYQLNTCDPRHGKYLACALFVRGNCSLGDVTRNLTRMKTDLNMVHWNPDGFKIGLCKQAPIRLPYSVLCLSNNCCIRTVFSDMQTRFNKLYRTRAFMHHYTNIDGMSSEVFDGAAMNVDSLISEYAAIEDSMPSAPVPQWMCEV